MAKSIMEMLNPNTPVPETVAYVTAAAKTELGYLKADETMTTTALGQEIWPWAVDAQINQQPAERKRLFSFLAYTDKTGQPTILPGWRKRGEPKRNRFGTTVRPWIWFNPEAKE